MHKERQIAFTFAQWWNYDGHHVDAIIEVLPKAAFSYRVFQVFVGGADEAEIDLLCGPAAEPLDAMLLQHAQELALQIGIQSGDFIKEQSPGMRSLNQAGA